MSIGPDRHESDRLRVLRSLAILDTAPEQGYDDLTRLASLICETPISLVSFVDEDRQWFKSTVGTGARETPRTQSFCAHTLPSAQTLVVEDAHADPRFQNNPLVLGDPNIRFYAGAPIIEEGEVLGTVCVIDTVPRTLSETQVSALEALARQVTVLLAQRKALADAQREAQRLAAVQQELRHSEELVALAAEGAGVGSWFYEPDRNVVGGDAIMGALFGISHAEAPAESWIAAIHEHDRERVAREFAEAVAGAPYDTEYRVMQGTSCRWVRAKASLFHYAGARRMVGICEDVTGRKQIEETLRSTAARLSLAQSAGRVATWEWTLATDALRWEEESFWAYGRPVSEINTVEKVLNFVHADDRPHITERLQPALAGTGEYNAEFRVLWPDGSIHWTQAFGKPVLSSTGCPVALVGFNIDITNRKIADEALMRTEKLAAVGRLASSIAHEINNPLEAVTNLLYLAQACETLESAKFYLQTAEVELRRASVITNQTLRFHKQSTRPKAVSFEHLVEGAFSGLHGRLSNSRIQVETRNRSVRPVLCFEGEIRQVLSNLIGNAIDAMHGRGGTLFIRCRDGHDWRTGKPGMVASIADTGTGMPETTRQRLFDAFFTTKGIGGTGLGLWISKEILDRHQGRILVKTSESPTRSGTLFTIFLPFDAVQRRSSVQ